MSMISKKNNLPPQEIKSSKASKLTTDASESNKTSECCMGNTTCSTTNASTKASLTPLSSHPMESKKGPKTRIVIKYDVGFSNFFSIRGRGAELSWDKGICLKNIKNDEWVWETEASFTSCEFKILINDKQYELGENRVLRCGATIQYTPKF